MAFNHSETERRYMEAFGFTMRPLGIYGADKAPSGAGSHKGHCLIPNILAAVNGPPFSVDVESCECVGGKNYLGYETPMPEGFEYFLSTGRPDVWGGRCERFKKTPDLVRTWLKQRPRIEPVGTVSVFQALGDIEDGLDVDVVLFFANPDQISALVSLVNYPTSGHKGVTAPWGAGCSSLFGFAMGLPEDEPGGVIGMFDIHARQYFPKGLLSFAMKWSWAERLAAEIPESFLSIEPWLKIRGRGC